MKMSPISVVIWTDSYGTSDHYFPELMKAVIKDFQNPISASFNLTKINAQPGRVLDNRFMEEYEMDFFGTRMGKPQMNVILLGGNDIQTSAYNGAARFIANIQTLTGWHDKTNCPLMLCGVPPRPRVHHQIEDLANYIDSKMKQTIAQRHSGGPQDSMFRFVKTFDFFKDKNGFCMTVNMYGKDQIHLSVRGALKFCEKLYYHIDDQARACSDLLN